MFELTSLHEAYTGSIIAGKGKNLNNIRSILERFRFKHEDWARVRFGAGTPWRRCWFVITPPDEKEVQKMQKSMKKRSAYDRAPRLVMGNISFYDSKKTKKARPIATINNAYAAYAIYPQSKALIDQSTLVKIEGQITTPSKPVSTTEGFVFVMPEVHPALSGFEILLRFLVPIFDTFSLYGRPTRLIAETNHIKSIMFAFPKHRRYGYLDTLDVANLMQTPGSENWSEEEWRKQLKGAAASRMAAAGSKTSSIAGSSARFRSSLPNRRSNMRLGSAQFPYESPEMRPEFNQSVDVISPEALRENPEHYHARGSSDTTGIRSAKKGPPSFAAESSPVSSDHDLVHHERELPVANGAADRSSSDSAGRGHENPQIDGIGHGLQPPSPPSPVAMPPEFTHRPGEMPSVRPQPSPDLRKANNRMSSATLAQLADAGRMNIPGAGTGDHKNPRDMHMSTQRQTAMNGSGRSKLETIGDSENASDEVIAPHGQAPPVPQHAPQHPPPVPVHAPPVPDHRQSMIANTGGLPYRSNARGLQDEPPKVVKRKPVPQTQSRQPGPQTPAGEPSFDELRHTVDEDALNQVGAHRPSLKSNGKDSQDEESIYDDASTASPDYSSTHGSVYSRRSTPRPRMGVMKTVGNAHPAKDVVVGDARYTLKQPQQASPDVPSVDFGPTLSYFPTTGRPRTSDTVNNFSYPQNNPGATERRRHPTAAAPVRREYSRSPSQDEVRRSMAWQPGMARGRSSSPGLEVTPEEYVQQRAAHQPVHVHHRASSMTPPPLQHPSGDWAAHSQGNSHFASRGEMPPHPHSRGANSSLSYNDLSSHLTAREQEHVARMTGSPFFNFSGANSKPPAPVNPTGLVGAIDAREREKQEMKEGLSNKMVQQAIAQRQQHQQHLLHQQQRYTHATSGDNYSLHPGRQSVYNLPAASHTWDAVHYPSRDDDRRRSWYGPYASPPQNPPAYEENQMFGQHPGYFGNANTTHS